MAHLDGDTKMSILPEDMAERNQYTAKRKHLGFRLDPQGLLPALGEPLLGQKTGNT